MKKMLIALVAIVVVAAGAVYYLQTQKPEHQILGRWEGTYEIGSFDFKDDGTVTIGFAGLSSEGEYSLDSEHSVLSIEYKLLGISYTKAYDYVLEKDILELTDRTLTSVKLTYDRVVA